MESPQTRSLVSVAEIVLTLLLGAWVGVVADRLLLAGRRQTGPAPAASAGEPLTPFP